MAGRRRVNEIWLSGDVEEIEALAEDAHTRVRRVPADQLERRARTNAPQGVVAFAGADPARRRRRAARRSRGLPRRARRRHRSRRTSARSCARPRPPAPPAWCSRATVRSASRRRSPRPQPARSSTSRRVRVGHPRRARTRRSARTCGASGSTPTATRRVFELPVADQPLVLVLGAEGRGLSRLARVALRGGRVDPDARSHRVAQRERGRRGRVHRDRAATGE